MPITKDKKKDIIEKASGAVSSAESVVFVNFHGLNVAETTKLRRDLKNEDIGYVVAKKTLVKRALDESKIEGDMPELSGELAVAYGKDLIAPARGVYNFQRTHEGKVAILGGIFEGKYMNAEEMTSIATIPGRDVLYAQFLNIISSPIQGLAIALNAYADKKNA